MTRSTEILSFFQANRIKVKDKRQTYNAQRRKEGTTGKSEYTGIPFHALQIEIPSAALVGITSSY